MIISFVGDIMLGRFVARQYSAKPYQIVQPELIARITDADYVIANLESPVTYSLEPSNDHLVFQGNIEILNQFKWVDCFSLSNNHINDCGTIGMKETIESLEKCGVSHNGLFKKKEEYLPYIVEKGDTKIAIITCADMMNVEFEESNEWKTIRIDDPLLDETISTYKRLGYFIILYAHVGMLFTRYPNPPIRNFLHEKVDVGVDLILSVHSHVLGGVEKYKDSFIFHSLGDFVMDGGSFRRRNSGVIKVSIEKNKIKNWELICATINHNLQTTLSKDKIKRRMLRSFENVSGNLTKYISNYNSFYKNQYKKELLYHSFSTIHFLFKTKGLFGLVRVLSKRIDAVFGMVKRVFTDRSQMRYDADAVDPNNTHTIDDLT